MYAMEFYIRWCSFVLLQFQFFGDTGLSSSKIEELQKKKVVHLYLSVLYLSQKPAWGEKKMLRTR